MRKMFLIVAVFTMSLCGGCLVSLHPYCTDDDLEFDEALVGTWQLDEGEDTWVFGKAKKKTYSAVYTDKKKRTGAFKGRLFELGGQRYLNLSPDKPGLKQNDWYKMHLLLAHSLFWVEIKKDRLQLVFMDLDYIEKLLKADPRVIKNEKLEGGQAILTASTEELQAFILKHAEKGLFKKKEEGEWKRVVEKKG